MSNYRDLLKMLPSVLEGERNFISNTANFSALVFNNIKNLNWVGFYIYNGKELIVGPFQGQTACVRIKLGNGVCGKAAEKRETIIVEDVNEFEGHIACDPNSRSEIVVPIVIDNELIGVLDIDSPLPDRFNEEDKVGLESLLKILIENTDFEGLKSVFK